LKEFYKTVIISELHIGSKESNIKAVNNFLKYVSCDLLIVNGGIFGNKKFSNTEKWKKSDNKFFTRLESMIKTKNTKVVFVGGINEYWMESHPVFEQKNIAVVKEFSIKRESGNYLVVPGDIIHHTFYKNFRIQTLSGFFAQFNFWLADRILGIDTTKNGRIFKRFSNFGKYISQFEKFMADFAKRKGYNGVICAHNHYPTIKKVDNMDYMNSGDWVDSLSALVEDENGLWRLSYHAASRSINKKAEKSTSLAKPTTNRKAVA
jgi:UDP-2,3-diacylglucosamine pyrophosphatase LpxH